MELAIHDLEKDYIEYGTEFLAYFPLAIEFVEQWRREQL
jgi:hypothetical protein